MCAIPLGGVTLCLGPAVFICAGVWVSLKYNDVVGFWRLVREWGLLIGMSCGGWGIEGSVWGGCEGWGRTRMS